MKQTQRHQFASELTVEENGMDESIDVETFDSFEVLSGLEQDWDSFMEEIGCEIFLSYDWCRLWWKYYGKDRWLRVFVFRNSGRIVGILPVFMENLRLVFNLKVVKIVGTDFMPTTISLPVSPDYLSAVIPAFLNRINVLWQWDILNIGDLSGCYEQLDRLRFITSDTLQPAHTVVCKKTDVQTYFEVAGSLEEQIKALSARQRTKTKRVYKELRDKDIILTSITADAQNHLSFLESFIEMHQVHWQGLGMAGHFVDWPYARLLHRDMALAQAKHDRLRILKIMLNDQCIGYEYLYRFGNAYCWFLSARKDLKEFPRIDFHRIAFGEKINQAIRDNVKVIDALRGHYEYKLVMGGQLKPVHSVIVYSNSRLSRFRYQTFKASAWLLNVIYMKIWRRRVMPKLKIKPKTLPSICIKTAMFSK